MTNRTIIPFGPQHPVLPEPIHLDLVVEDETVIEAIPSFGFVHRGLEKLVEKKDFHEFTYVAERVCGICSFIHGMGYCQAVEHIMGLDIPQRAKTLRTFWAELSRAHSHLMWLGLLADAFGYENLFMQCWRIREAILDIVEETAGGRVIFGGAKIGGTRRDVPDHAFPGILQRINAIEADLRPITDVFEQDYSVQQRLRGVGIISRDDAYQLGAVGPTLRGSGDPMDARREGYASYHALTFDPIVETDGDSYARCIVRIREIFQSFDLIRQLLARVPGGETDLKVKGYPLGEHFARLEQPRGEVLYYVKGNGTKHLDRFRVRTPTFANIPPLLKLLQGCDLADVPLIVLTIDPCISCAER
ncbi:MAG TPA: nickel-dependent hydrogenase large subunit [Kiritimatiellia bacterium]|nr:nickel-dependent hydrogenase large subunit [Kiritimatiellia bacterium]